MEKGVELEDNIGRSGHGKENKTKPKKDGTGDTDPQCLPSTSEA